MVRELRKGISRHGLVLANGGLLTYQYAICLSSQPRDHRSPYPDRNSLPEVLTDLPVPPLDRQTEGQAIIEASLVVVLVPIYPVYANQGCRLTPWSIVGTALLYEGILLVVYRVPAIDLLRTMPMRPP